jgi:hypothetical protein
MAKSVLFAVSVQDEEEFDYGNRANRSYCKECNKEEKQAYNRGGRPAAKEYRENQRKKWKNT